MKKKLWKRAKVKPYFIKKRIKSFDPSLLISNLNRGLNKEQNENSYQAKNSFGDFLFVKQLTDNISAKKYFNPTPIQDKIIPLIMENKDIIGLARTGSGKTGAFLMPLINKIYQNKTARVLIVVPTRELALQIDKEFKEFSKGLYLFSAVCIGGLNIKGQIKQLIKIPNIVIGTPGRLKDLEGHRALRFSDYNNVVLDEVDRLMDMGFIPDIRYIISRLPQNRQSLFFSATMPAKISEVAQYFLKTPVTISINYGTGGINIDQSIIRVNGSSKIELLHDLLIRKGFDKVLIFGRTKWGINKLLAMLLKRGFRATAIHGNKSQGQRQRALSEFRDNRVKILLATDIASRGLDIDNVTHVINYDLPESYEDYIHRIGRTGRLDKKGIALTFID